MLNLERRRHSIDIELVVPRRAIDAELAGAFFRLGDVAEGVVAGGHVEEQPVEHLGDGVALFRRAVARLRGLRVRRDVAELEEDAALAPVDLVLEQDLGRLRELRLVGLVVGVDGREAEVVAARVSMFWIKGGRLCGVAYSPGVSASSSSCEMEKRSAWTDEVPHWLETTSTMPFSASWGARKMAWSS